jgi:uncharacterized membrane protein YkgB
MTLKEFDAFLISRMQSRGIPALRIALGIALLWFGALKLLGMSPVANLVEDSYFFLSPSVYIVFWYILGTWEVLIGLGLLFKIALRATLALLWLQMAGTFTAPIFAPEIFFIAGNPLVLTLEGQYVVKNLVLIAASLVIAGYEIKPLANRNKSN